MLAANSSQVPNEDYYGTREYFQRQNTSYSSISEFSPFCGRFHEHFGLGPGWRGIASLPSLKEGHQGGYPIPLWECYLPPGWFHVGPCLDWLQKRQQNKCVTSYSKGTKPNSVSEENNAAFVTGSLPEEDGIPAPRVPICKGNMKLLEAGPGLNAFIWKGNVFC